MRKEAGTVAELILGFGLFLMFATILFAAEHKHPEKYYQNIWCKEQKGVQEAIFGDGSRCDCLTDEYAVEFDFAPKWAESIGQSLLYAANSGKQAAIVLIMENPKEDSKYTTRLWSTIKYHNLPIRVFFMGKQ